MRAYRLIRSDRKTLSIGIDEDAELTVRAPRRMPKAQIDAFVESHEAWIAAHLEQQRARMENVIPITVTAEEERRLREALRVLLTGTLPGLAARMGVGYTRLTITGAETRWGSCSGKNALSFSWRMMLLPEDCREYVMVHELAHIRQHNHSAAFYAEIAQVMPDYEERVKKIREFSRTHKIVMR